MKGTGRPRKLPPVRNRFFVAADLGLIPLAVVASFWLRVDDGVAGAYAGTMAAYAGLAAIVKPAVFFASGLYRRFWRYASARDLVSIAVANLAGTAVVTLLMVSLVPLVWDVRSLPRSIPFIDWLVSLSLLGGVRFATRLAAEVWAGRESVRRTGDRQREVRRVLVMGAGDAGAMIVREMQANPGLGLVPVALVDDNRSKVGMTIHGVPVRGTRADIRSLVEQGGVDELVIAMPTAPGLAFREIVAICREVRLDCRTIPGIYELISGRVSVRDLREVRIGDLLRREQVEVDDTEPRARLNDAVVLVTGAGGSIGSELCRQIASHHPRRLLLLGHGENSIYDTLLELERDYPYVNAEARIADVRHHEQLEAIVGGRRPDVIFHAAAHKHVPLMESNVAEAVSNNVFGTRALLRAAELSHVGRFVFISTDKAVNPTSVMGATKRLGELLLQDTARRTGGNYIAVRFGNVLGSRGSVVPLFRRQIASGGPVTVTDPEVERYFMTIPEAVQLVLQAMAVGQGGEVFVLDMGEPVRVADLAADLINLCGLEPGHDIEIVFTGLRPGEKLREELFAQGEEPRATRQEGILMASGNNTWASDALAAHLDELTGLVGAGAAAPILAKMQEIVPEYKPAS